ncbi:hypothetical protein CASFOL_014151 [Castilleja foliolosa]|uniref:Uncharacterized protein n=1 Tax=Castilleja foliolosa TaxID=1961234 RepID=A0ABD3DNS4_9LAMI
MAAAKILCGGTTLNPRRQSATFATNKQYSRPKLLYSTTIIHPQPPKIIRAFSVGARRGRDDNNKILSFDVRKRLIDAIDFSGRRLKSNQPQKSVQALAANTYARLQVYDDGISHKKLFSFKIQCLLEKAKMAAIFLIRVSFTLPFEASNVPGYAVAILLFIITLGKVESIDLRSGYLYRAKFIDCIFSYVFGDGDPNQGIEEKRWKMIGLYIALNGCVVTAEEIAPPYLLDSETKKMNDESYMLPVLNRFNGQPIVDESGNILYHFPSLHCTSLPTWTSREYAGRWVDRGIKVDKFLEEQQWKFSKLDDKALDFVSGILRYNLFCVVLLGFAVEAELGSGSFYSLRSFIPSLITMYAIYAVSFNVISSIRWVLIKKRNAEIVKRNEARRELAKSLESPNLYLMQKLSSARAMAWMIVIGNLMVSSRFTDHRQVRGGSPLISPFIV